MKNDFDKNVCHIKNKKWNILSNVIEYGTFLQYFLEI